MTDFVSINCRGLQQKSKREILFQWLNSNNYDVALLQETHCTDVDEKKWISEWEGDSTWCNGASNSRGVAVLLKKHCDFKLTNIWKGENGRAMGLILHDVGNNLTIPLINIYAPNDGRERETFFDRIENTVRAKNYETNIILGGDMNCTLNRLLDRESVTHREDMGTGKMKRLINILNLEDVWRRRNPSKKAFTFRGKGKSRIDLWLIDRSFDPIVTSCSIINNPITKNDHCALTLRLKFDECERGPGIWKLNASVLETYIFKESFQTFWVQWRLKKSEFPNLRTWWDIGKGKIKDIAVCVGKRINEEFKEIRRLEQRFANLSEVERSNIPKGEEIQAKINTYYERKAEAARIRAKENWFEKGEKSTKYFFDLEKHRAQAKHWLKVKTLEGKYEEGIEKILKRQVEFYQKLYKSEGQDKTCADSLLECVDDNINQVDKTMLDKPISFEELKKSVHSMKKGKSPGEDGIGAEFYQMYWEDIGGDFTDVVHEVFLEGDLSSSQKKGLITLLYKKGEREDIANWRPITLLNLDYKIIAKSLASRLKEILPKIIHPSQKGSIAERRIDHGIRLIQDVITYHEQEKLGGAIIFLDQTKAFDRVERSWLKQTLEKFGFGENFVKWVTILYDDAESSILTNGYRSKHFKIERSVRQGCPIAPYLYVLQAEPFMCSVRKNSKINGIKVPPQNPMSPEKEVKNGAFVDDTQLFISTVPSIDEIFRTIGTYEKASGAAANYQKTEGMLLGSWKERPPPSNKIKWKQQIKALGVWHGYNIDENKYWEEKLAKIEKNLKMWRKRNLSFKGKVLLIKSLGISVVGYETQMKGMPENMIKPIKDILFKFLWDNKPALVNKEAICLPEKEGGLNMIDVESFIKIKQIKWIDNIINSKYDDWNALAKYWLQTLDERTEINYFITKCSSLDNINIKQIPQFYKKALETWVKFKENRIIRKKDDIMNESIFANNFIKSVNGRKSLVFYNWLRSGICKISDVWDGNKNKWITEKSLLQKLKQKHNWMGEFFEIKQAIPKQWLSILREEDVIYKNDERIFLKVSEEQKLSINDKPLDKCNNKTILSILQVDFKRPKCTTYWNHKFNKDIPWKQIWQNLTECSIKNKIRDFQWKCIHNTLNTNRRLKLMHKSNGLCPFCEIEDETQFHLFKTCNFNKSILRIFENKLRELNLPNISEQNILFGFEETLSRTENLIFSNLIIHFKWIIWKNRNNKIFNNKTENERILFQKVMYLSKM